MGASCGQESSTHLGSLLQNKTVDQSAAVHVFRGPLTVNVNEILDESWKMLKAMQQHPHCSIIRTTEYSNVARYLYSTSIGNRYQQRPSPWSIQNGSVRTVSLTAWHTERSTGRLPNLMWLNLASNCISSLPPEGELQGLQARFVGRIC